MKTINVVFEDTEFNKLDKKKGNISWHDFILSLLEENNSDSNGRK